MFKIVTDSTADLPAEYLQEHDLGCINLSYIMDGVTYGQGQELPEKEFYALMRNGKMPTTSQVNPEEAKNHFLKYLKENKEILCIAFSSGLSGTYNSMRVAAEEIMEEQPDCRIIVIDSLCASLGEGLLVHKAVTLRDQGKSLEEVAEWVKNNRLHLVHVFTVDDLYHLYRGGRVSRATAVVGTLAGIKPKLHVDDEGHLIVIGKVRGRKKSLHALVDYMEEKMRPLMEKTHIIEDDLDAYVENSHDPVYKLYVTFPRKEEYDKAYNAVKDLPVFLTDGGWAIDLEVMSRDTDKGVALKALASRLGIPREQVLAMGDSGNDCAMLRYAGIGAAMGNGSELAKKAADVIAPSNREDGVAWMLRRAARGEI